jgi:hypothetical protein
LLFLNTGDNLGNAIWGCFSYLSNR